MITLWNYGLENVGLLKCLKSLVSEHLFTVNMLKDPKDCLNLHGIIFVRFSITLNENQLKKFSFRSICNFETVC